MQVDLLQWSPRAEVVPFPLSRRYGTIRKVAENLLSKSGASANSHWQRTVETLSRQMQRAGIPEDELRRQLLAFHNAVQTELQHRAANWPGLT